MQLLRLLLVLLLVVAAATTLDGAKGEATGQVAFRRAQLTHHGKLASLRQHHGVPVPPVPTPAPKGPSKTSLWTRIKADVTKVKTKVEANIAKSGQKVGQFAIQTGDDVLNLKNSIVQQSQKQGSVTFSSTNCSVQNKCPLAIVKNFQGEDITKQVHAAFQDGKFTQEHFKTDITLYRCTGGGWDERKGAGNWWSPTIPTSSAESMSRLAISKDWGTSQLKECWSMKVKGGTLLVYGTAAPQTQRDANGTVQAIKGGGKQFYVDHPIPGAIQAPFKLPAKRVLFGKF